MNDPVIPDKATSPPFSFGASHPSKATDNNALGKPNPRTFASRELTPSERSNSSKELVHENASSFSGQVVPPTPGVKKRSLHARLGEDGETQSDGHVGKKLRIEEELAITSLQMLAVGLYNIAFSGLKID
jgi:hypothetical protein